MPKLTKELLIVDTMTTAPESTIVLVHDKRCPFCRSLYPAFTEAISIASRMGKELRVKAVDRELEPETARKLNPTVPAILKFVSSDKPPIRYEGRRDGSSIFKFMVE